MSLDIERAHEASINRLALVGLALIVGILIGLAGMFPTPVFKAAFKTARSALYAFELRDHQGKILDRGVEASPARWHHVVPPANPDEVLLVQGGLNQFLELCPGHGCAAVLHDRTGNIEHAYPFRPGEIAAANSTAADFAYEAVGFSPERNFYPVGIERYDNGDLLLTFQGDGPIFPYGLGVARIRPDGQPVWSRLDYSHHWPHLTEAGHALVPSTQLGNIAALADGALPNLTLCRDGKEYLDEIRELDGDGKVLRTYPLVSALLASRWAHLLRQSSDNCDRLHLNFIAEMPADLPNGPSKGDLLVSMRNISSIGIIDRETGAFRDIIRGDFLQQHSAQPLTDHSIVLFNNWGADANGRQVSQVMEIDLLTRRSRVLFPPDATFSVDDTGPEISDWAGYIDVSPERDRILVAYSELGRGFEIDAATGELLATYDNLHQLADDTSDVATRFSLFGMSYSNALIER